jgi:signal transduction histidine kinase
MDRDPAAARASVRAIQQQARGAMVELRRLLALLRSANPETLRSPLPGLAELDGLVERMRGAGLQVEAEVVGAPCDLPVAIDLSAYRIIQEGLTNVLVHSGASTVTVLIAFSDHSLELDIRDHGHGTPARFGTGLTGVRERVTLLGGELHAGPADPGWRLRVRLPIAAELRA